MGHYSLCFRSVSQARLFVRRVPFVESDFLSAPTTAPPFAVRLVSFEITAVFGRFLSPLLIYFTRLPTADALNSFYSDLISYLGF